MDIYKYAESIAYGADYLDPVTGYIYGIQEVGRMKKFFDIDMDIPVYSMDSGELIGYARRNSSSEE